MLVSNILEMLSVLVFYLFFSNDIWVFGYTDGIWLLAKNTKAVMEVGEVGWHFQSASQLSGFCMLGSPCTGPGYGLGVYLVTAAHRLDLNGWKVCHFTKIDKLALINLFISGRNPSVWPENHKWCSEFNYCVH